MRSVYLRTWGSPSYESGLDKVSRGTGNVWFLQVAVLSRQHTETRSSAFLKSENEITETAGKAQRPNTQTGPPTTINSSFSVVYTILFFSERYV